MVDARAKEPIGWEQIYTGGGFSVTMFVGDKDDYIDFDFPAEGITNANFTFGSVFMSGGWEQVQLSTGDSWLMTKDMPMGHKSGVPVDGRPGGVVRAYCLADNTQRLCAYPTNDAGSRTFEPVGYAHILGTSGTVVVPQGGQFLLAEGSLNVNGQQIDAVHVIKATTADLTLSVPSGVFGLVMWHV
jgi:hypothetical protein